MLLALNTLLYVLSFLVRILRMQLSQSLQVNVDDGYLNLMTTEGVGKDDVKLPEGDLGKQIEADFEAGKDLIVTIVSAMGEEAVRPAQSLLVLPSLNCL
jgi:hypothetical protein